MRGREEEQVVESNLLTRIGLDMKIGAMVVRSEESANNSENLEIETHERGGGSGDATAA